MLARNEPIAVIGSSCRLPGDATSPSKLWQLLRSPRDVLSKIPKERFNVEGFYHPDGQHHGAMNVKDSYFLSEDVSLFDTQFFGIKPVEARCMDPQHRLLLETVYEGLECAGIPLEKLAGSDTAVFVGQMCDDWSSHITRDFDKVPLYTGTGIARSITSNRVSWFFDWHGPSVTIDTACSSSLVAVHQAVAALRNGESPVAIAAGTNLILTPEMYIAESKLKMLSPTGRSRMWDADADGYARGEGVATLVMKKLSDAIRDGDHIDYLIRETVVNSDGRTNKGITMPSAAAQTQLIRTAYERAGLDICQERDRPQYFEAHGTGTPAGDPQEAEAISSAFFGSGEQQKLESLYVGSIKTILGHAEGTAGIAGILRAGLALQHGIVPPNMHFNTLSDSVAPFYTHLKIATQASEWPSHAQSDIRRASVNSFGFGGANAHAILETYDPPSKPSTDIALSPTHKLFPFSAATHQSLFQMLTAYCHYLETCDNDRLHDLSYTLQECRSELPCKVTFAASSADELYNAIHEKCVSTAKAGDSVLGIRSTGPKAPTLLAIFTGQGAQWISMGRCLIQELPFAREVIARLDEALNSLPEEDRPSWNIQEQLQNTDASLSHLHEAEFSQPLCSAVQILLVDLLRKIGVRFKAVVGHSSGEIAAAYAAGFHTAADAIRIAYYRGLCVKRARTVRSVEGAMLAAGTTFEDAQELCSSPEFEGKISVAASNAPSSVTLSGDSEAIDQIKVILEDEKKFARKLKVDTAYHSHHMQPCAIPYMAALDACGISRGEDTDECTWFSSVDGGKAMRKSIYIPSTYWRDNLLNPVLFSQAVTSAIVEIDDLDGVIEIGPHPALKGPATQTISEVLGAATLPYMSVMSRGQNDAVAFLQGIGDLWAQFGKHSLDTTALRQITDSYALSPRLLKGLPTYTWEHMKQHWTESRASRAVNAREDSIHQLLGVKIAETATEVRWKTSLIARELPWVSGHRLQGQTVFPGSAYIVAVLEGAKLIAKGRDIKMITIEDMTIGRALTIDEDDESGVEAQLTFNFDLNDIKDETSIADFRYCSSSGTDTVMNLNASGRVRILFGQPIADGLPPRSDEPPNMNTVDDELFYSNLDGIGYQYKGAFRALSTLKRALGCALGVVHYNPDSDAPAFAMHPGPLDAAIQSVLLAFCWPGDGRLRELHVPTGIRRISFNPFYQLCDQTKPNRFPIESGMLGDSASRIEGDVAVFVENASYAAIQLEGLEVKPFASATEANDRHILSTWHWEVANPDGALAVAWKPSEQDKLVAEITEHSAIYYLKKLVETVKLEDSEKPEWFHKFIFNFAHTVLNGVADGTQPFSKKEWLSTTPEQMYGEMAKLGDGVEVRLMKAVGENLPNSVLGKTQILEHMLKDNLLNDFYVHSRGISEHTDFLANAVQQIVHRYGDLNIIEVGGGTGGATKKILKRIGHSFKSYMFTDVSTGFFEKAQEVFAQYHKKMNFKALDLEQDVIEQGFVAHSYDLIVASAVLHATESLEKTLANVRQLLRPGGFLVALELADKGSIRICFSMAGLPGIWIGHEDGRVLGPCASPERWDSELRKVGFSGIDTITPQEDLFERPCYVFASRATDDRLQYLDNPTAQPSLWQPSEVIILGGSKTTTREIADASAMCLQACNLKVTRFSTLEEISDSKLSPQSVVLSLVDLDQAVFKDITDAKLAGLKTLLDHTEVLLWITRAYQGQDPYGSMSVGWARSLLREMPLLKAQFMDVDLNNLPSSKVLIDALLRLDGAAKFRSDLSKQQILLSEETETLYRDSKFYIPRLRLMEAANNRFNSSKRTIQKQVSPGLSTVELIPNAVGYSVQEPSELSRQDSVESMTMVRTICSSSMAVKTSDFSHHFVVYGTEYGSGKSVVALSSTNASRVNVDPALMAHIDTSPDNAAKLVYTITLQLLAKYFSSKGLQGASRIHVHGASTQLYQAIRMRCGKDAVNVSFSTSEKRTDSSDVTYIHPRATRRIVAQSLPNSIGYCLNMEARCCDGPITWEGAIPPKCQFESRRDVLTGSPIQGGVKTTPTPVDLEMEVQHAAANLAEEQPLPVNVSDMNTPGKQVESLTTIHWENDSSISAEVQPIDSKQIFSASKTYALFGLTSDLAQSLCKWMIQRGAKYVVLTSRNPKIEDSWKAEMKSLGARVEVFSSDITSEDAFVDVFNVIQNTMPPVGGVANGAMVLNDTMFREMTLADWTMVTQPKMCGSIFLNKYYRDPALEFFVMFSSVAGTHGNDGQSNYSAANMFSTGLVHQRRREGLRASVMHIGPIAGAGYITREVGASVANHIHDLGHAPLAQTDFFTGFAESVLAGRLDYEAPEVVLDERIHTGKASLESDPKYQFTLPRNEEADNESSDKSNAASVRAGLNDARSFDQAFESLKEAFFTKLSVMLQEDSTEEWKAGSLDIAANELGVDSLIAVHIRTWFLKEIEVDCPVLKILGGATIRDILEFCISKIPSKLTPNLDKDKGTQDNSHANAGLASVAEHAMDTSQINSAVDSRTGSVFSDAQGDHPSYPVTPASNNSSPSLTSQPFNVPKGAPTTTNEIIKTESLSFAQERFWTLMSLMGDSTPLNIGTLVKMEGSLCEDSFENAIQAVCQKHEVLRTGFSTNDSGDAVQTVFSRPTISLERLMIENEQQAHDEFERLHSQKFDLKNGATVRLALLKQRKDLRYAVIIYHHIAMDGVSLEVFLADLQRAYNGQSIREEDVLQYSDYSSRQRQELQSGVHQEQIDYWRRQLDHLPGPLPLLPFSRTSHRESLGSYGFNVAELKMSKALSTKMSLACQRNKVSLFHFFFAAYKTLLTRLLQVDDICIGIADANRLDSDTMMAVGNYLNLLPVRFPPSSDQTPVAAMKDVRMRTLEALSNSRVPFDTLLEKLQISRSASYSPIFQAFINYRQGVSERRRFGDAETNIVDYSIAKTGYDISLDIIDNPGGEAIINVLVQKSLYSQEDARLVMDTFTTILEAFSNNPHGMISEISLYSEDKISRGLELGRGKVMPAPNQPTLVHMVDKSIAAGPHDIALKDTKGSTLSYKELSYKVSAIASAISPNVDIGTSRVVVFQQPSVDWVCSMLAVMRVGAAYVPMDPKLPPARIEAMLNDCNPTVALVNEESASEALKLKVPEVLDVSQLAESTSDVPNVADCPLTAAILYTSGSTGKPKGVILRHDGLRNELDDSLDLFSLGSTDTVLQQSALSFDLSLWQCFAALASGGTLCVASATEHVDPMRMSMLLKQEDITMTIATPTEYMSWLRDGSAKDIKDSPLRVAVMSGEMVSPMHSDELLSIEKPGLKVFNGYGPTEASIVITKCELKHSREQEHRLSRNPVGYTSRNCVVYVVDESIQLLPPGFSGEILIGGCGVAVGYVNKDEPSRERFLTDPFATSEQKARGWTQMYRTGDRGYFDSNGALVVEARIAGDTEIKLRGIRMDVQDIEKAIVEAGQGAIKDAVVTLWGDPSHLVAHLIFSSDIPESERYQAWIQTASNIQLPQHMIPSVVSSIDVLPLNAHGKVDRRAVRTLPVQSLATKNESNSIQGMTPVEKLLIQLWLHVLPNGIDAQSISPDSDFFFVGGNSASLVKVQRAIRDTFLVSLPLASLFEASTLQAMASRIGSRVPQSDIAWKDEVAINYTSLQRESRRLGENSPRAPNRGPEQVVLMTGATGHLGRKVVEILTNSSAVAHIHAVAVRNPAKAQALQKSLPASLRSKVTFYEGDLSRPRLGLERSVFNVLINDIDTIIHCGAARSFWDHYQTLRDVNVSSIGELLLLAASRKVPIHFISSGASKTYGDVHAENTEHPPIDGTDGYVSTKWVGEQILRNASTKIGVPAYIYKMLPIRDHPTDSAKGTLLQTILDYTAILGCIPSSQGEWTGRIDVTSIDKFANDLVRKVAKLPSTESYTDLNCFADVDVTVEEIADFVQAALGDKTAQYGRLPAIEWVGRAKSAGFPYLFAAQDVRFTIEGATDHLEMRR